MAGVQFTCQRVVVSLLDVRLRRLRLRLRMVAHQSEAKLVHGVLEGCAFSGLV